MLFVVVSIVKVIADLRKSDLSSGRDFRVRVKTVSTADTPIDAILPVSQIPFTTEWLLPTINISGNTVLAHLNETVEATAVKSGRLQKYQAYKDLWRDEVVVVDETRIWFYQLNDLFVAGAYSYIDLVPDASAFISEENSCVIIIVNHARTTPKFRRSAGEKDAWTIKLKAKSKEEALEWFTAIKTRRDNICDEDNLQILLAEEMMANDQKEIFQEDVCKFNEMAQFEGMMENRFLRQNFQNFLKRNFSDEFLKFWEYAEDFRRGHPNSPQPLSFSGNGETTENIDINSRYIKHWAKQVFEGTHLYIEIKKL